MVASAIRTCRQQCVNISAMVTFSVSPNGGDLLQEAQSPNSTGRGGAMDVPLQNQAYQVTVPANARVGAQRSRVNSARCKVQVLAMNTNVATWLRGVDYFTRLQDDDFLEVAKHVHLRRYSAGQVIMFEGEACDGLYIVREGRIRVFKMSPAGKEQVLRIIGSGESFNDVPVFDGGSNPASADCLDDSEVGILTTAAAEELLRTRPGFSAAMLRVFARRLRQLTVIIEDFAFHSVRARLARALLQTAENGATHLTQRDLAELAGTAREVAGRELREMERQGVVRIARGVTTLLDAGRLERIAGGA